MPADIRFTGDPAGPRTRSYSDPGDLPMALACAGRGIGYLAYSPFGGPAGPLPQAALAESVHADVALVGMLLTMSIAFSDRTESQ